MKKIFSTLLILSAFFALAQNAFAGESNCQVVYGGGQTCTTSVKFTVNKLVQIPTKGGGDFVDNFTINDQKLSGGQTVNFKIVITNTGDTTLKNLTVVDTFPQFLNFTAGNGTFNSNNKTLTFVIDSLDAGKSAEFVISAKASEEKDLPNGSGVTCTTNNVLATDSTGSQGSDNAQVCIQKNVLAAAAAPQVFEKVPTKQIPATGPELYSLIGLIPAGLGGIYLRRKSSR